MGLSLTSDTSGLVTANFCVAHGAGSPDVLPLGRSSTRASRIRTLDQNGPNDLSDFFRLEYSGKNIELPNPNKHKQTK